MSNVWSLVCCHSKLTHDGGLLTALPNYQFLIPLLLEVTKPGSPLI